MEQQMTKHENIFNFLFSLNFFIVRRQYWVCVDILNFTSSLINCLHRLLPPFSQKSSRKVSKKALTTSTNIKVGDKRREAIAIGESMEKQQYTYYTVSLGLNHNKGLGWRSRILYSGLLCQKYRMAKISTFSLWILSHQGCPRLWTKSKSNENFRGNWSNSLWTKIYCPSKNLPVLHWKSGSHFSFNFRGIFNIRSKYEYWVCTLISDAFRKKG